MTVLYCRSYGSDITGVGTIGAPFETPQRALLSAVTGDFINLDAVAYSGTLTIPVGISAVIFYGSSSSFSGVVQLDGRYQLVVFYGCSVDITSINAVTYVPAFSTDKVYRYSNGLVFFDECSGNVSGIGSCSLFSYHSQLSFSSGFSSNALFEIGAISSVISFDEATWFLAIRQHFIHGCRVSVGTDLLWDCCLTPVDVSAYKMLSEYAAPYMYDGVVAVSNLLRYGGNARVSSDLWLHLYETFEPLTSDNSAFRTAGYELNADSEWYSLLLYFLPAFSYWTPSAGNHVGCFSPVDFQSSYQPASSFVRYLLKLIPDDLFIPKALLSVCGILDDYQNGALRHVWDKNSAEIRQMLRAMFVSSCQSSGSVPASILGLKHGICSSFIDELNRRGTLRVGPSYWSYDPAFSPGQPAIRFDKSYLYTWYSLFNKAGRYYLYRPGDGAIEILLDTSELVMKPYVLLYLSFKEAVYAGDAIASVRYFTTKADLYTYAISYSADPYRRVIPMVGLYLQNDGGDWFVLHVDHFRDFVFHSDTSTSEKYNGLMYSYATKSRGAVWQTALTSYDPDDPVRMFVTDMRSASYPYDTRLIHSCVLDDGGVFVLRLDDVL